MVSEALDEEALAVRAGAAIRAIRERSDLSMREVAARAGISQPFLSQIERGLSMPSMITVYRLAEALGVTPGDLLPASTDDQVEVVRRGDGQMLPVSDRADAAIGRVMLMDPQSRLQIIEYSIKPDQYIGEWFQTPGVLALYLIGGELDVTVEGAGTYRIGAGELITHPSPLRHRWLLVDNQPADALLIISGDR
ncbi:MULTISPECIES: helix-turn-helix domain-containing protein [unclassified Gordonia (in: high G+C Gram-positive bacteria)]|uniref:helix-turn-helix domain-containing protein n=1 Tax=unclassified Gordonia (in: high G+C Gram-positive bacteria) TaxID=2657482 RepID=UPI0007EBE500|nr:MULTISPECIES: XRE family transcriptional regulator [unclassified Gordonia (in: high G+C Gram-positive bacteria)]OBC04955.1 XRE family transcriptional regulator [Gordonia sp. 852002-50395_SCH5434458]OBC17014.1 XRE family transcriptional regulator [Gordonia sp. 852002-50816_SCH5313054-c]OBC20211.1 XRE family transcriptional regulator [Gordonia sp. 852002-50816_SCH5313054-a]